MSRSKSASKSKKTLKASKKTYRKSTSKKYRTKKKAKYKTHKVKAGQTLYSIARKHRTSVKKIKRLNRMKSDKIRAGSRIRVF